VRRNHQWAGSANRYVRRKCLRCGCYARRLKSDRGWWVDGMGMTVRLPECGGDKGES